MHRGLWTIVGTLVAVSMGIMIGVRVGTPVKAGSTLPDVRPVAAGFVLQAQGGGGTPGANVLPLRGSIAAVDLNRGVLTLRADAGGQQVVQVTRETRIMRQATASVKELKVGEMVMAAGQPTEMTVGRIQAVSAAAAAPAGGGARGGNPRLPFGRAPGGAGQPGFGFLGTQVRGQIVSLEPLKISLGSDETCVLRATDETVVVRIGEATLRDLKTGEMVMGFGEAGPNGIVVAKQLNVGLGDRRLAPGRPGAPGVGR